MVEMRIIISAITLLLFASLVNPVLAAKPTPTPTPKPGVKSVCLDAGHGGYEIGTSNQDLF